MKLLLRLIFLAGGFALLAWFAAAADWQELREVFARVGWFAPFGVLPYLLVYAVDTWAWRLTLLTTRTPSFRRLFVIRWIGEAVNNLVPTGYVGGEAVKVLLLRREGVSLGEGTTAAVISKTAQTIAQAVFVMVGAFLFIRLAPVTDGLRASMLGIVAAAVVVAAGLVTLQRRGLGGILLAGLDRLRVRFGWVNRHRDRLISLDSQIRGFYAGHRRRFVLVVGIYMGGWLLDSVEVFVVGHLMGFSIDWEQALAVEAFVGVAKVLGLLVPGAVGVQESGIVLLCRLAGLPGPFGYAYAVWRRGRELLYAGLGWLLLSAQGIDLKALRGNAGATSP